MTNIRILLTKLILLIIMSVLCSVSMANTSAVVLQYHHVSNDTPSSTSVTPAQFKQHLVWLKANNFDIISLTTLVQTLTNKRQFKRDKVVAITFDDANISVCETAWPILQEHNIPFTLFISTEAIERRFKSQCTWAQMKIMVQSGLMTPANHSHKHLNMVDSSLYSKSNWQELMRSELLVAQQLIDDKLGKHQRLFAYPYGEYNADLEAIVKELGFIGFGQHSGAIGPYSDFIALPRFPASSTHANIDTLQTKLLSLAFDASVTHQVDNPIAVDSPNNPPELVIEPENATLTLTTRCYNSLGEKINSTVVGQSILIKPLEKLSVGRHRYTCTSPSSEPERFYWISHQWLVQ